MSRLKVYNLATAQWEYVGGNDGVRRFASVAERDALWPPATAGRGALCITLDNDVLWQVRMYASALTWMRLHTTVAGSYTPALVGVVVGTGGINTADYTFVGSPEHGLLTIDGKIKLGTAGFTVPQTLTAVGLPPGYGAYAPISDVAQDFLSEVAFYDVSAPEIVKGVARPSTGTTVRLVVLVVTGTKIVTGGTGPTAPFAWATGDEILYRFQVRGGGPP